MTDETIEAPKKRKAAKSPTQRTLERLRSYGWLPAVVERHNTFSGQKIDLFGIIDIIALRGKTTLGVQATSYPNISARVRKIAESEHVGAVREAGWSIEVWGWHKVGRFWEPRIVDVS